MSAWWRLLLLAYPAEFRRRFGDEMVELLEHTARPLGASWLRVSADLVWAAARERWDGLKERELVPRLCSGAMALAISSSLVLAGHRIPDWVKLPQLAPPVLGPTAVLHELADPTIAFLLLVAALYGLLLELSAPGTLIPGGLGLACAAAGLLALAQMPVNYAGLAFLCAGVGLLLAGVKVSLHGILGGAGVALFLFGTLLLFDFGSQGPEVSEPVLLAASFLTLVFFGLLARLGAEARRLPALCGLAELVGQTGQTRAEGQVLVLGERWRAASDHPLTPGQPVRVMAVQGFTLTVEPLLVS